MDWDGRDLPLCCFCYDAYHYDMTYNDEEPTEGGYEIDDIILAVSNMVCADDINRISACTHPYAEAFREYSYSNFSEDESAYVGCHMEAKKIIEKLNTEDEIFFLEDTTCILDQVYYSDSDPDMEEEIFPLVCEFESFLANEGIRDTVEDYAWIEFDVENSDCDINLGVLTVKTDTGWYLLAIDA